METVKGFQDVENWAVKDLEGRNWETWIILINIHRLNQKENDKLQFWSCLDLSLLWEQGWQTWELRLKKKSWSIASTQKSAQIMNVHLNEFHKLNAPVYLLSDQER